MSNKRNFSNRRSAGRKCPDDHPAQVQNGNDQSQTAHRQAASNSSRRIDLSAWREVMIAAGVERQPLIDLARTAQRNGTTFFHELACSDHALQDRLYRSLAVHLGIPFLSGLEPQELVMRDEDVLTAVGRPHGPKIVFHKTADASNDVLISPAHFDLSAMRDYLRRYPSIASRLKIVSPRTLRKALIQRAEPILVKRASTHLFENYPRYSARMVANATQGFCLGLAVAAMLIGLCIYPSFVLALLHCFFSLCFLSCVTLRVFAALDAHPPVFREKPPTTNVKLPFYSVLVALYKEADVVPDLIRALKRMDWPASKLDIKLILEKDDNDTLEALRRCVLPPNLEILKVPNLGPRTKPKALTFALPTICGEYVAVYDAEDTPHPAQLREAWAKFEASGQDLACLQAPLQIRNGSTNLLTRLFAFEYSALFRGLLPALARKQLFFPLGGTSNHFRVSTLRDVCDWDPYNVTEDADLAVRLQRFGFRLDVISYPTFEDAPETLPVWIRQRTRWFKGWMQTFLVHGRNYPKTLEDLNFISFVVLQIILFGMIISSLAYIAICYFVSIIIIKLFRFGSISVFDQTLLMVDLANVSLGLSGFLLLGWRTMAPGERKGFWKVALATPAYWLIMSISSWRAVWQLYRQPFYWEKTPHRRHSGT